MDVDFAFQLDNCALGGGWGVGSGVKVEKLSL